MLQLVRWGRRRPTAWVWNLPTPKRRVFIFDGDGSLLMNLGSLVTISGAGVSNLYHFVFANRVYEVNGNQPLPAADTVDFEGMARSAGYLGSRSFNTLDAFHKNLSELLALPGPQMAVMEIVPGQPYPRDYDYIHSAAARQSFRDALNA
jgi:sulfopyruvate decarboxylase subunit beta